MQQLQDSLKSQFEIPISDCEMILSHFREEILEEGDSFIREGNLCAKLGYINDGLLKTYHFQKGEENIKYFSVENQWIGNFDSFLFQKQNLESVQALTKCKLLTINYDSNEQLKKSVRNWPEIYNKLKIINEQNRTFNFDINIKEPRKIYELFIQTHHDLALRLSTESIASYLKMPHKTLLQVLYETVMFS